MVDQKRNSCPFTLPVVLRMLIPSGTILVCYIIHRVLPNIYPDGYEPAVYGPFLIWCFFISLAITAASCFWKALRKRWYHIAGLVSLVFGLFELLDLLTLKSGILLQPLVQSPDRILNYLIVDLQALFSYAISSLEVLITGIVVGIVAGFICGILAGWSKGWNYWIMPALKIAGPVPAFIWLPIAMYIFPNSFFARTALVALAVWFPLTLMLGVAMRQVNKVYSERARILGSSSVNTIFRVMVPASLPAIFDGLFMGFSSAFGALSVAEMLGSNQGLAIYLRTVTRMGKYANAYATVIFLVIIFFIIIFALMVTRKHALSWQVGTTRQEMRR